jgi:hypothetical protein
VLRLVAGVAVWLAFAATALAAEPVRRVAVYVQPYYEAARTPGEAPRVGVGKQFDVQLASLRRQDILSVRDRIAADSKLVTPMTLMVLAIRLYDVGLRDDAVFWFYAAKERTIVLAEVLDLHHPGLAQVEDAVRNFATLAGPVINGYAFCDLAKQREQHAKAIAWVEANPYAPMFMKEFPAKPGDRAANHKRGLALIKSNTAKERAYLDDAKNAEAFHATRKRNEADIKFCWK